MVTAGAYVPDAVRRRDALAECYRPAPGRRRERRTITTMTADPADALRRLPAEFVARARAIADGSAQAVPAKAAATVVLLRDTSHGIEAYLLRRTQTMAFAAGMHVFPGGSVDPRDEDLAETAWSGPRPAEWAAILTADERLARALVCAAVRETFEESGVLLAGRAAGDVVDDTRGDDWEADRLALIDRSLAFAAFLERRGLVLRADLLRPWAHWITPEVEPRRYDTRFFVAALPEGQRTRDVGGEADRVAWMRPQGALDAFTRGEVGMLPPTAFTLAELSAYDTVTDVLAAGTERDVRPVLPRVIVGDDEQVSLLLPHEEGYGG